jgi:DUF1680 family protein
MPVYAPAMRVDVVLTPGSFWGSRWEQVRNVTVPVLLEQLERHGVVDALRTAVGDLAQPRQGLWFTDSDLAKWLEAAIRVRRFDLVDPVMELLARAQAPDGYLSSWFCGAAADQRYTWLTQSHELYCMGHLIEAAVADLEVRGETPLVDVARRIAGHVADTFGPAGPLETTDGHPEIELALARFAIATGDERALETAEVLLRRGPLDVLDQLWGHAVRAIYFATGAELLGRAAGRADHAELADRLWTSMVGTRMYVTGGVGGRWLGEMTGKPFELPSTMAYAETCAAVAAFRWAMLRGEHDTAERILYNGVLAGVGADGASWHYSNPLASDGQAEQLPWADHNDFGIMSLAERFPARRLPWYAVTCCPTNATRLLAELPAHVAGLRPDGAVHVRLPTACTIATGGSTVTVDTGYPWADVVRVSVDGDADVVVEPVEVTTRALVADPRVEAAGGRVAVVRGPIVYCAEGVDHDGLDVRRIRLDRVTGEHIDDSLTGRPVVLTGRGTIEVGEPRLYRDRAVPVSRRRLDVTLVPYYQWGERGIGTMAVWLDG